MEPARHHQNLGVLLRRLPDAEGHVGLPGQAAVLHQLLLRRVLTGEQAVGVHLADKGLVWLEKAGGLEIFLPEFLKTAQAGPFTQQLLEPAGGQIAVAGVAQLLPFGAQAPGVPGGQQDLPVGQVHEPGGYAQAGGGAQGGQLRGMVQEGVIAPEALLPALRVQQPGLVPVGVIEGYRGLGVRVGEDRDQVVGVFRPLHQDAIRDVPLDDPLQMPGAGGTVVPHRVVENRGVQGEGDHFNRLLAS